MEKGYTVPDYIDGRFYDNHATPECCLCLTGSCVIQLGTYAFRVLPGDFCAIGRNVKHFETYSDIEQEYELLWFRFHTRDHLHLHQGRYQHEKHAVLESIQLTVLADCIDHFDELVESDRPWEWKKGKLLELVKTIEAILQGPVHKYRVLEPRTSEKTSRYQLKRLEEAMNYIKEHCRENTRLEEVAARVGLTPGYFETCLRRMEGSTFIKFLNSQRLQQAHRLLTDTTLRIREIAFQCGFDDPYYFSRLFKQYTGISPQTFRSRY